MKHFRLIESCVYSKTYEVEAESEEEAIENYNKGLYKEISDRHEWHYYGDNQLYDLDEVNDD